ncbi:enoyl-CoA hydratase/isomerase family protein [Promicromonospora sp. MEB111]|uniref:enoyl-CoA hydratase/isomerase family protein n=1 Tax=Promicromonospora sp. MEB111 TaxID=3040301 RepID=UPI0025519812|nr:enoyl-CoA hydratase/isomerase family protein [Promicromonospora sp. MEB111]
MAAALRRVDDRADRLHVRLDRPEVRNAIDKAMVGELHEVCAELEARPRILVLSGSERVFASGADIAELRERGRDDALAGINSRLFERIARLPMPVIAAVDGWALGGGAELAYAADFRLAGENARFGNPEVGLGIIAAAGASWRLKELVGETLALEVLLAGRVLDAPEALAAGLVSAVHASSDLVGAADALADRIAEQDPTAVRYTKQVFRAPRAAHPDIDDLAQSVLFESPAKRERMTAFLERKKR